jgi:alanyl-tRNA synthetase
LVPKGDPTLLFTSAGVVQIKPYFTGEATPPNVRLASCQKCFRTTDIESVGDHKHLTFFEMLGNFSVGDYFKKEAIEWAWEFVTQHLHLPPERLWISVYLDDDEAFGYWRELGVPADKIVRYGEEDNFWGPPGGSGPCGPCSEIHYDFGEEYGCGKSTCGPNCDCERFTEVWNLVFTEYNQDVDGHRTPLAKKNIDTGLGLERVAAILQGKQMVYDADVFAPIIQRMVELSGREYGRDQATDLAIRVVAEHGRAITFLIGDGVIPSNEGRGYVLRRVLRRAALFGRKLGLEEPFLAEVAKSVMAQVGHVYPEIVERQDFILKVIEAEEERFEQTLNIGLGEFDDFIISPRRDLKSYIEPLHQMLLDGQSWETVMRYFDTIRPSCDQVTEVFESLAEPWGKLKRRFDEGRYPDAQAAAEECLANIQRITGAEAFKLYDTYGFPVELTQEVAAEHGLTVDLEGFKAEMERQRERARAAHKFKVGTREGIEVYQELDTPPTNFVGYEKLAQRTIVLGLVVDEEPSERVSQGQEVEVILAETPFYGEMGGQVGDTGEIRGERGKLVVTGTFWPQPDLIVHRGRVVEGALSVSDVVEAEVDVTRRLDIARNHTATHLLQAALRKVLGSHVYQSGSLVAPDRFRFDFTHPVALTEAEISEVQRIVNSAIRQNLKVVPKIVPYHEAIDRGAIALFDEKYGAEVRLVEISDDFSTFSAELCGGTHVKATGEIGLFYIISESSIGAGLRRIEAVTGRGVEEFVEERLSTLRTISRRIRSPEAELESAIIGLLDELEAERRRSASLQRELAKREAEALLSQAISVNGVPVVAARVAAPNAEVLRQMGDLVRDKLGSGVVVLGAIYNDRPNFIAMVTPDLVAKGFHAGQIAKQVAAVVGGGGGGRAELGQAGGKDKSKLDEALRLVREFVHS